MSSKHNPRPTPSWEDAWFGLKDESYENFWLQEEEGSQVGWMKEWFGQELGSLPSHLGLPSWLDVLEPWEEESY